MCSQFLVGFGMLCWVLYGPYNDWQRMRRGAEAEKAKSLKTCNVPFVPIQEFE
jgi:hypothetical protein